MRTEKYTEQKQRLPQSGRQIIGCREDENIIVYQSFNPQIAEYAVAHQQFGGPAYSFNRMSWIKPGFLWMMYRAGWATKEHQERILRIILPLVHFKTILSQATFSSYQEEVYETHDDWKAALDKTEVRLQWDPDHDPFGNKEERKAIQLGMKGDILKKFCTAWVVKIEDITEFVRATHEKVLANEIEELLVPFEEVIEIQDEEIKKRIAVM